MMAAKAGSTSVPRLRFVIGTALPAGQTLFSPLRVTRKSRFCRSRFAQREGLSAEVRWVCRTEHLRNAGLTHMQGAHVMGETKNHVAGSSRFRMDRSDVRLAPLADLRGASPQGQKSAPLPGRGAISDGRDHSAMWGSVPRLLFWPTTSYFRRPSGMEKGVGDGKGKSAIGDGRAKI